MESRTAYNAQTIFKVELLPEIVSDRFCYTNKRQRWGGFLACSIKEFEVKDFAWFEKGDLFFLNGEDALTHEEFVKEYPEYRVALGEGGNPVAIRKAAVRCTFLNGKYWTEYFETDVEAEDYFNRLVDIGGQTFFEFDAFK